MKIFKVISISLLAFILLLLSGIGLLIKASHVDRLLTDYAYFDFSKNTYVINTKKPDNWVEIEDVAEYAKWAIIVSEDWAFYEHGGIDWRQLKIALMESFQAGEFTRGASTITQQVIKNTILSHERTLWRKLQETVLALYLEARADKERILEIYLNIIELGDDIYGISQASHFYFSKPASELNAREGAFLAMLLPSPVKYSTSFYEKELTDFAREQVDSILVKLRQADVYDEEERQRQSAKRFYWEKDFYHSIDNMNSKLLEYGDYLEDSYF